ncbi:MAG: MotA/TolQ/ExbB proton channel family protein [Alphaproteobacteria bacterium]
MADPITANTSAANVAEAVPVGAVEQLFRLLDNGGPVLFLLLIISILTLTLIIAKLFQFWMLRVYARGFVEPVLHAWRNGGNREALGILRSQRNPVARVLEVALHGSTGEARRDELLQEEITRVAGLQLDNLRSGLRLLALVANLSPLIGLLGTVIGMIGAFQALQNAGNKVDPSILSGGIWVALLTTAAGLIIAIPAAAAHNWMEGVVYRTQRAMEDAVTRVFTGHITPALSGSEAASAGTGAEVAQPAE